MWSTDPVRDRSWGLISLPDNCPILDLKVSQEEREEGSIA